MHFQLLGCSFRHLQGYTRPGTLVVNKNVGECARQLAELLCRFGVTDCTLSARPASCLADALAGYFEIIRYWTGEIRLDAVR